MPKDIPILQEFAELIQSDTTKAQEKRINELANTINTSLRLTELIDEEIKKMVASRSKKYGISLGMELKLDNLRLLRTKSLMQK